MLGKCYTYRLQQVGYKLSCVSKNLLEHWEDIGVPSLFPPSLLQRPDR